MKKYTISQFAEEIGVTAQTLRNWDKADKLKPNHIAPSGHRYYSEQQRCDFLGVQIKVEDEGEYISSDIVHERTIADFVQIAQVLAKRMKERESDIVMKMIEDIANERRGE